MHERWMMPGDGERREQIVEQFDLSSGVRVGRFVGHRQMGAHPGQSDSGRLSDGRGKSQGVVGGSTDPAHAGVDLQVDGVVAAAGHGDGLQLGVGVHGEIEAGAHRAGQFRRRLLAEHQDRAVETCVAQFHPLLHQRHAQPAGTASQRSLRNLDGAVAVTVGLDDGPHRGRRGNRAQHLDVVPNRAEVDLGPRPTAHNSSSSTAGIRSGRSLATKPCR